MNGQGTTADYAMNRADDAVKRLERLEARVARLEGLVIKLCDALQRHGSERDGAYGYPRFADELREIKTTLA
jgi:hypothetical protein